MALLRVELKNYNKRGGKTSVGAHANYLTQRSISAHAAHNIRQREGERLKDDLIAQGHRHMPAFAQGDDMTFWAMADRYSKANACLAKEGNVRGTCLCRFGHKHVCTKPLTAFG
jgi:hypothetical protein